MLVASIVLRIRGSRPVEPFGAYVGPKLILSWAQNHRIYLSVCLSIFLPFYLPLYLSISLSIYLPTYLSIYLVRVLPADPAVSLTLVKPAQRTRVVHFYMYVYQPCPFSRSLKKRKRWSEEWISKWKKDPHDFPKNRACLLALCIGSRCPFWFIWPIDLPFDLSICLFIFSYLIYLSIYPSS